MSSAVTAQPLVEPTACNSNRLLKTVERLCSSETRVFQDINGV